MDESKKPAELDEPRVVRIALTGGPCGGKTTAASVISDRLQDLGWRVFRVPEAASILLSGGFSFYQLTETQVYGFQINLLKLMMSLEDAFVDIAEQCGAKAVVLCDRGAMDCSAYMEDQDWQALLDELGFTMVGLRDSRYDCVVHLVTAADGAERFYNTETNTVRTETPEQARALDEKIMNAWIGHPYFHIIDNSTDFTKKISRIVDAVLKQIGEDSLGVVKRKFLVASAPEPFPVKYQDYDVDHICLVALDGTQPRIRRRGQNGRFTYTHTIRFPNVHGQRVEIRRVLSGRDFLSLKRQMDPRRSLVKKKRRSFHWNHQYYELDYYLEPIDDLLLLEAYMSNEDDIVLPDFLDVIEEVSGQSEYSLYQIALKDESVKQPLDEKADADE